MANTPDWPRGHMAKHRQNEWRSVRYDPRFDEYSVPAGNAWQKLFYCPWCGERLPPSQRDRWYDELEARGIAPNEDPIPVEYQTGAWRGAAPEPPYVRDHGAIEGRFLDFPDLPANDDVDED